VTQREQYITGHIAWLKGETDAHPGGLSGERHMIDGLESKRCWDTAPHAWQFSEFSTE